MALFRRHARASARVQEREKGGGGGGGALLCAVVELDKLGEVVGGDGERRRVVRAHQDVHEDPVCARARSERSHPFVVSHAHREREATKGRGAERRREPSTHLSCSRSRSTSLGALSRQKSSFLCGGDQVSWPDASSDLYSSQVLLASPAPSRVASWGQARAPMPHRGRHETGETTHVRPSKLDLSSSTRKSTSSLISSSENFRPWSVCT